MPRAGPRRGGAGGAFFFLVIIASPPPPPGARRGRATVAGSCPVTAPAEDYLRESASPYTLPALIAALGEVIGLLRRAERDALRCVPPGTPINCKPVT